MLTDKASWTAELTALFRAVESLRPANTRLFQDPYAAAFLRPPLGLLLKSRVLTRCAVWLMIDRRFPGASVTIASRIRYVDDCLTAAIEQGIEQLVILGAGYDARAHRFEALKDLQVFEVDHPNTQRLKKEKVRRHFGWLPAHVHYVPVDFESDALVPKLRQTGFNGDLKTFFIWEGVCKYLTEAAVGDLLTSVASLSARGSAIVFDYLFASMVGGLSGSPLARRMLDYQAKKGEPFLFGLPEEPPEEFIRPKGFAMVRNMSAARIKQAYFQGARRARDLHPFWGLIHATV